VDLAGRVVGINVAIAPSAQAISYAISVDAIYPHMQSMIVRGTVLRPDLGFVPLTVTPSVMASFDLDMDRGILALQVDPSRPAGQAGLQSGDVITAVDSRQVFNIGDFWHALLHPGDQSTAQLTAQNKAGTLSLTIPRPSIPKALP
jgi:S1-C subfamily serine protease